ncbi:A disintegrin and metalloproteinase with thrombospondin motifs 20-like [Anneissia japonica]|uniref:A disintegrin and metalloproteinase with thrombospondin motifs 20-like n=1 Tax=Anneissia japonica TaxID=1529436 RepID=UPI001425ACD7|nr:A disintegrin and metalloproteinase with thrombospondin motifs 20-like [Anneissia japonica]
MDKTYTIMLQGNELEIYCHQMDSSNPKEFLSLKNERENYSEIYPKRLLNPYDCPNKGRRDDNCRCTLQGHDDAGYTSFNKIRFNVTTMEVIVDDATFSSTKEGHFVPFGTAGDCYSAKKCLQGQFRMNFDGTGLELAQTASWTTKGNLATFSIDRDFKTIRGSCGGFCGKCVPISLKLSFIS